MINLAHHRIYLIVCAAILAFFVFPGAAHSQEPTEPEVHWAYASFLGTGWYKVDESREAFVVSAAPRWTVGEAGIDEDGNRTFDYTFRVPVSLGLTRFDQDSIGGILDLDSISTFSVGFSADVDIPVTHKFSLRPIAEVGYGAVIGEDDRAWNWRTELRGRYGLESGKLDWALLGSVGIAGYEPNEGLSDDFSFASLAAEFAYPVSWWSSQQSQTMLYWNLGYVDFIDEIEIITGPNQIDSVANYWHFGMALGKRDKPIQIWFLKFDRLGLAYKYSDTGRLRGIKVLFRSLYDL